MTNHIHLLVDPSIEEGLSNMIQSLGRKYVQYVNQTHKRTGTLWEGRFKSSLVDKEEYLLACGRYIELNPVRAKIVKHPEDYPWSSYGFKAEGKTDILLEPDPVYLELGKTDKERQSNYKKWFFRDISDKEINMIRSMTHKGGIIGNNGFIGKIAKMLNRDVDIKLRGRPRKSL